MTLGEFLDVGVGCANVQSIAQFRAEDTQNFCLFARFFLIIYIDCANCCRIRGCMAGAGASNRNRAIDCSGTQSMALLRNLHRCDHHGAEQAGFHRRPRRRIEQPVLPVGGQSRREIYIVEALPEYTSPVKVGNAVGHEI